MHVYIITYYIYLYVLLLHIHKYFPYVITFLVTAYFFIFSVYLGTLKNQCNRCTLKFYFIQYFLFTNN